MDLEQHFAAARWRKANGSDTGGCVEVAYTDGLIGVRDTKASGSGPILAYTEHEWKVFLAGVAAGEFTIEQLSA